MCQTSVSEIEILTAKLEAAGHLFGQCEEERKRLLDAINRVTGGMVLLGGDAIVEFLAYVKKGGDPNAEEWRP